MARILIADDERDLVDVLAEILRDEGHEVLTCVDGVDALRAIRTWHPDVAILDVDMPGMSGTSVAASLVRDGQELGDVRVVLLSGNAHLERVAAALGVRHFVTKPVAPEELIHVLESALSESSRAPPCRHGPL